MASSSFNGKLLPALAIAVTLLLAGFVSIAASNYTQGGIAARVAANTSGIASFDGILRSIDRRLARIEGRMPAAIDRGR